MANIELTLTPASPTGSMVFTIGTPGPQGPAGPQGNPGVGVPVGGEAGQVLAKVDGTDYNTEWVNVEGDYLPLAGGSMNVNAEITLSDGSVNSEVGGWGFGVQETATPANYATVEPTGFTATTGEYVSFVNPGVVRVERIEGNEGISLGWNGIQFYDSSVQTTAYPGGVENKRDLTDYNFTNVADTKLATFGMTIQPPTSEDPSIYNSFLDADELKLEIDTSVGGTVPGYLYRSTITLGGIGVLGQTWTDQDGEIVTSGPSSVSINYNGITFPGGSFQNVAFPGFYNAALTGTPTAVTQSAGNNTTALATTAFVQTSNPDASTTTKGHVELATNAETVAGTSTTLAVTPNGLEAGIVSPTVSKYFAPAWVGGSIGTGSSALNVFGNQRVIAPTSAVGVALRNHPISQNFRGVNPDNGAVNFSKRIAWGFRLIRYAFGTTDVNSVCRVVLGKTGAVGTPTTKSIGIYFTGTSVLSLMVHDGTTLRFVDTTFTPVHLQGFDAVIISDGTGNVSLFVNGTLAATSANGPVGNSASTPDHRIEVENIAALTGSPMGAYYSNHTISTEA